MTKQITYTDAVRILGAGRPAVLQVADRILGGAILGAATLTGNLGLVQLVDVRSELLAHAEPLLTGLGAKVRGASGRNRTELMVAAHTVVVVESFFTAFINAEQEVAASAGITLGDQLRAGGGRLEGEEQLVEALLTVQPPMPTPTRALEEVADDLLRYYAGMGHTLAELLRALAVWDSLNETERSRVETLLTQSLPSDAVDVYRHHFRQLCIESPEFELWVRNTDSAATRTLIRRLAEEQTRREAELRDHVMALGERPGGSGWPERVGRCNTGRLAQPIAGRRVGHPSIGPVIPSLDDGFVTPSCHVATVSSPLDPIGSDEWWDQQHRHPDAELFVRAHLMTPLAVESPLILFGRPGSGKSVFTRWLAAVLDPVQFLPVLVELREVPADLELQDQIEHALRRATGVLMSWPALVESTVAMPVVLLDGFDELLQASLGVRSDFLERVAEFQQREAEQGRAVAVLVTSRTVVADQATCPSGTVAARLAPFSFQQVSRWLKRWNQANAEYFRSVDRQPLTNDEVMVHAALATEPLLLQMLALYDAETGALPRRAEDLDVTDLYERLLRLFVEREVRRIPVDPAGPNSPPDPERELERLAIAAFAMFNRHRQHATEDEIHQDLVAVLGPDAYATEPRHPVNTDDTLAGRLLVGRFFFIHESRRMEQHAEHRSYEFLHATFAEYLIARFIGRLLPAVEREGERLWRLLSWAPLSDRRQVLTFLQDLMSKSTTPELDARTIASAGLAWTPNPDSAYQAGSDTLAERLAASTANALLVSTCVESSWDIADVAAGFQDSVDLWRRLAMAWRSCLRNTSWTALADTLVAERIVRDGIRTIRVGLATGGRPARRPLEMSWSLQQRSPSRKAPVPLHRQDVLCDPEIDVVVHAAEDPATEFPESLVLFGSYDGRLRSLTNILLALRLSSASTNRSTAEIYRSAFTASLALALGEQSRIRELLFRQLAEDAPKMTTGELVSILDTVLAQSDAPPPPWLELSSLVIGAVRSALDVAPLVDLLHTIVPGVLALEDGSASLYVALARAGLDPVTFVPEWTDSQVVLRQVQNLGLLAQREPSTVVDLFRMTAGAGVPSDDLLPLVLQALPVLSAGSLLALPAGLVQRALDHVADEVKAHKIRERWEQGATWRAPEPGDVDRRP